MPTVWQVQHSYEIEGSEETKQIGIFSSRERADAAVAQLKSAPGFCDHPEDFYVDEIVIDEISWQEGFAFVPYDDEDHA